MNIKTNTLFALILLPVLAGCGEKAQHVQQMLAEQAQNVRTQLQQETNKTVSINDVTIQLENGNLKLQIDTAAGQEAGALSTAELGADGHLLINGQPILLNAEQQQQLQSYHQQLQALNALSANLGQEGANIGIHAAAKTLQAILSGGDTEQIQQEALAEASQLKEQAQLFCAQLQSLQQQQQALATLIPDFAPYADIIGQGSVQCQQSLHALQSAPNTNAAANTQQ